MSSRRNQNEYMLVAHGVFFGIDNRIPASIIAGYVSYLWNLLIMVGGFIN